MTPEEFEELRAFLGYFFEHRMGAQETPAKIHPVKVLDNLHRRSPAKAGQGLRMAIGDCIEMTRMWPPEDIMAFDAELNAHGLITLSAIQRRYSKRLQSVLKRQWIRSEVEYYLVRGAVEDPTLTRDEALIMRKLLTAYEEALPISKRKR
ncbi:MAG TPA: hypothetical protein VN823_03635 [Stellaceae bacterium]|nr:hypothetical protein [Stellaceae bacterium]